MMRRLSILSKMLVWLGRKLKLSKNMIKTLPNGDEIIIDEERFEKSFKIPICLYVDSKTQTTAWLYNEVLYRGLPVDINNHEIVLNLIEKYCQRELKNYSEDAILDIMEDLNKNL